MTRRNLKRLAPPISDVLRQELAKGLARFQAPEAEVFKGNLTLPMVSVRPPGGGRINRMGSDLVGECARRRGHSGSTPGALRRLKSPVPGYEVFEPEVKFDETVPELYELKWDRGNAEARIDLLPMLQPKSMEVPAGYVTEIQMTLEDLGGRYYILLHLHHAKTRPIKKEQDAEASASESAAARAEEESD